MTERRLYGAIEAGGTKFVVGVLDASGAILAKHRIATTAPDPTIAAAIDWLRQAQAQFGALDAIGIASFGPVERDPAQPRWGDITATAKPGWSHTPFASRVADAMRLPVGFDTDVGGAALAEARWGAARGCGTSVYITVGTGIGAGAVVDGRILAGGRHSEMGHIRPARYSGDDFPGICPFHGDCLEGLASGPAIVARWGAPLSSLDAAHPAHATIAHYIAQMVVTIQAVLAPHRIVIGGGVLATPDLLEAVRHAADVAGGGYFSGVAADVIVAPGLGEDSGLLGGLALALGVARLRPTGSA